MGAGGPLLLQHAALERGLKKNKVLTYLICSPDSSRSEELFTSANETQLPAGGCSCLLAQLYSGC